MICLYRQVVEVLTMNILEIIMEDPNMEPIDKLEQIKKVVMPYLNTTENICSLGITETSFQD